MNSIHPLPRAFGRRGRSWPGGTLVMALASLSFALLAGCGSKSGDDSPARWPKQVTETIAEVPVLAEGRVKPFDTWAAYTLLRMNSVRSARDADDNVLSPREWALDLLFRPDWAGRERCFLITTDEVLTALEIQHEGRKKRDRYSFQDLEPGARKLMTLAPGYMHKERADRTPLEEGLVRLYQDMQEYTELLGSMDFARHSLSVGKDPDVERLFEGKEEVPFSDVLAKGPGLAERLQLLSSKEGKEGKDSAEAKALNELLARAWNLGQKGVTPRIFPPLESAEEQPTWYSLADVTRRALTQGIIPEPHLRMLRDLEALSRAAAHDPSKAVEPVSDFLQTSRALAQERGEYGKIELEVKLYELDPFHRSLYLYLLGFVFVALTWLKSGMKWITRSAWVLMLAGLALHTYGIVLRCIIRERPPVSTLYETVLFITAMGVLTTLIAERINKRRIAFALAPILGVVGLFIAGRYEVLNRSDTMPRLQAVLDTNFWLTTHVTAISIGYMAGLVASLVAHVYVLGRFFRGRNAGRPVSGALQGGVVSFVAVVAFLAYAFFGGLWIGLGMAVLIGGILLLHLRGAFARTKPIDESFYRTVGRMVYGLLGFALLFSLVGTILGGIWANESWGRFWGWDPKENGALLICLSQVAILHARMGGMIKVFGLCVATILGGVVVVFSWWGVNLLGIGLHSYGFTSGIWAAVLMFYVFELLVLAAAWHAWLRDRSPRPSAKLAGTED